MSMKHTLILSIGLSLMLSIKANDCSADLLPLEFGGTSGSTVIQCLNYREPSKDDTLFIAGTYTLSYNHIGLTTNMQITNSISP